LNQPFKVATGISKGINATPQLAQYAVEKALEKAHLTSASNVLLLLTSEFAANPQSAIKAAAKAASTTQVIGCSASGLFTEEEWVLDGAAAAAMVFSDDTFTNFPNAYSISEYLLTLAAPTALDTNWLKSEQKRFGGISGDATGFGPFSVWQNAKGVTQGYCECAITNRNVTVATSHGLSFISEPQQIRSQHQFDVLTIGEQPALSHLRDKFLSNNPLKQTPYYRVMLAYADSIEDFNQEKYQLCSIIVADEENLTITLSHILPEGSWVVWAVRSPEHAVLDIQKQAHRLKDRLPNDPLFAFMFSCIGRGPNFYDGHDQDLKNLTAIFPQLPIIGFYGNGEIAPTHNGNALLQYSAVLALFG
jgi:small ligand-binding sensory domain FIST